MMSTSMRGGSLSELTVVRSSLCQATGTSSTSQPSLWARNRTSTSKAKPEIVSREKMSRAASAR